MGQATKPSTCDPLDIQPKEGITSSPMTPVPQLYYCCTSSDWSKFFFILTMCCRNWRAARTFRTFVFQFSLRPWAYENPFV